MKGLLFRIFWIGLLVWVGLRWDVRDLICRIPDDTVVDPKVSLEVGLRYNEGNELLEGGKIQEAFELFKPLADKGYSYAQFKIGEIYFNENRNYDLAEKYLLAASVRGQRDAQTKLGRVYEDRHAMKHRFWDVYDRKALAWRKRAAGNGDTVAHWVVGMSLLTEGKTSIKELKDFESKRVVAAFPHLKLSEVAGAGMPFATELMKRVSPGVAEEAKKELDKTLLSYEEGCKSGDLYYMDRTIDHMCFVHNFMADMIYEQDRSAYGPQGPGSSIEEFSEREVIGGSSEGVLFQERVRIGSFGVAINRERVKGSSRSVKASAAEIIERIRPGDLISVSDGIVNHLMTVHSIDRKRSDILLIDGWPDKCLLLKSRNAEGVEGIIEREKGRLRLIRVAGNQLGRVLVGIASVTSDPTAFKRRFSGIGMP